MKIVAILIALVMAQQAVFRSRADAVLVDVSVMDRRQVVPGLTANDFEVFDNGVLQTVVDAGIESVPVDASILLDVSQSARVLFEDSHVSVAAKIRDLLRPGDLLEVTAFGPRGADWSDWNGKPLGSWAMGAAIGDRGTALFDVLVASAIRPPRVGFRRLLVVLTDGKDTMSFTTQATRLAVVDRSDAVIQVVSLGVQISGYSSERPPDTLAGLPRVREKAYVGVNYGRALQEIADRSGGYFFSLNENRYFLTALDAAIKEFRTRYIVRYVPQGVSIGGWHTLRVGVKGRNYEVKARKGYQG